MSLVAPSERDGSAVDVFLSYDAEDREAARALVDRLEGCGWSVWWDRRVSEGRTTSRAVGECLAEARCVVVLWSPASVRSDCVRSEAGEAARRHVLVPVLLDGAKVPLTFRRAAAAGPIEWARGDDDRPFEQLVRGIERVVGASCAAGKDEPRSQTGGGSEEIPPTVPPDDPAPDRIRARHGPGTRVAHYEILSRIGSGGMGVVFKARDLALGREVALKRPFETVAGDACLQERFRREISAASILQHPNIVTVFEGFVFDGYRWVAMELIDGCGLPEYLDCRGPLGQREVLRHAEGLADALRVAHGHHIIHRDIKPSNILIDRDGLARLTDFGLVRFEPSGEVDSRSETPEKPLTKTGQLLGTLAYMAPEQVLGKAVDARADIFSLGCVIYEMCTATPSFGGDRSEGEIFDAVLHGEPTSIARHNREISGELERIVGKCLAKRADERYQHVEDLLADLRAERRRFQASQARADTDSGSDAPSSRKRSFGPLFATGVAGGLVAIVLTVGLTLRASRVRPPPEGSSSHVTVAAGWEGEVAISPDGASLAYASNEGGNDDIWLIDASGGRPLRLTTDPASDRKPCWYADGSAIAFVSDRGGSAAIWRVPRLGGSATMLVPNADSPAISPDGRRIAFTRTGKGGQPLIAVANLGDPGSVRLLTGPADGLWGHEDPAWSPDGRWLAYADFRDLWLVPSDGGTARQLTRDSAGDREPAWSEDGRYVYFTSSREGTQALWRVSAKGGQPQRLTMGTGSESHPSLSRDGRHLAYTTSVHDLDAALVDRTTGAMVVLPGERRDWGPTIAPDGSAVVWVSNRGAGAEDNLWRQALDGMALQGEPVRLNDEWAESSNPAYSPDGRWIAYQRREGPDRNIWIVPSGGGFARPVTEGPGTRIHPAWSPDGSRLAYVGDVDGRSRLWVVPISEGLAGEPRQLETSATVLMWPDWSPNGSKIAYVGAEEDLWEVWVTWVEGESPPHRVLGASAASEEMTAETFLGANIVRWDPSSESLLVSGYWGGGGLELRTVDPETGRSKALDPRIDFGRAARYGQFNPSRDARLMGITFERGNGDVWLLEAKDGTY